MAEYSPATQSLQRPSAIRRVQLVRTDRIAGRFWRRSQAERAALSYRELGYAVEVSEDLRAWPFRGWGRYAVLVSGKTL
jgi:hypothetical protein